MNDYSYQTDSEFGLIQARDFSDAINQLSAMLPREAILNGAWGWVEDLDGYRFEIRQR